MMMMTVTIEVGTADAVRHVAVARSVGTDTLFDILPSCSLCVYTILCIFV